MIYAINITTTTKNGDLYDEVAVNKFPLIIITEINSIDELLKRDYVKDAVRNYLKTQHIYENAKLYIRVFDSNEHIKEHILKVPEVLKFKY